MRSLFALSFVSISLITACASEGEYDELAGESADDDAGNVDGKGDAVADGVYTYFTIKGDTRKCAFPTCGGTYVQRLNRSTTVCHNGSSSASCYTPELDFSESGLEVEVQDQVRLASSSASLGAGVKAIVRGRFAPTSSLKGATQMGRFIVTEAWVAQTAAPTDGVFVKAKDNGVRCIAAPCASTRETALNTSRSVNISEIDYAPAGLTDEQIGAVTEKLFQPSGIIIAGDRYTYKFQGRKGTGRTATNVFVRVENPAQSEGCFVGGCSGQICSDQEGVISTCEWREEYACYQDATCERQASGECGWTPTATLNACLADN
jgi:hypothetical protein